MNRAERRRLARQLGNLTDAERLALQAEVVGRFPTHLRDQIGAATTDAERRLRRLAATRNYTPGLVQPSPRLRERVDEMLVAALAGDIVCCEHAQAPQPLAVTLWETPHALRCLPCAATADVSVDEVEDNTCDLCRRHDPDGVYAQVVQVGVLLVSFGSCEACLAELRAGAA